jgi:hypothetical protein
MKKITCPACKEEFKVDLQNLWDTGEVKVLRGQRRKEAPSKQAILRQTKRVNVICPHCGFEFLVPLED